MSMRERERMREIESVRGGEEEEGRRGRSGGGRGMRVRKGFREAKKRERVEERQRP